jgi:asparagine synthase (glutamine-hydrolysing)
MCGIYGELSLSENNQIGRQAEIAIDALSHRGPDQRGTWHDQGVFLGIRRLSIIDLKTGHQPIANKDESCWIVHNGEIYNFLELRRELEQQHHHFRTRSDTEVILHGYEEWGPNYIQRLRGMFAFAIYDRRARTAGPRGQASAVDRRLFLARDRVGKKPIYYYRDADRFVFASEIKALLAHPDIPRRVNRRIIPLYLAYGYVPPPHTAFEDIYELPPGHILTIQDGQITERQYWDITYPDGSGLDLSEGEIIERLRRLMEDAVRLRLVSDVPLGAFLSGGMDSTGVVAFMAHLMDKPVKTFAIGFESDPSFNELQYARLAVRTYGTDHHEFVVQPNAIDLLPKLVWHYDQPFADSSAIPTYLVSQLTREHVTVALTGDGGDELFAGYERFAAARLAEGYCRTPQFVQAALAYLVRTMPESTRYDGFVRRARRFVENAPLPLAERYLGWVGIFDAGFIRELLAGGAEVDPVNHFQSYFQHVDDVDPIGQLLYVNTKTYLPGDLLVKTDRMSMANSLEVRCPFLDHEFLEFAAHIPSNLKLRKLTTKYILKKALKGMIPREIIRRKKHGFGVPVGLWFRTDLKDYVRDVLLSPQALRRGYFRKEALQSLIDEHQSGRRDHGHRLWALLTFEIWHRVFFDKEMSP